MAISVDDEASAWFRRELDLPQGAGIRFFGKVYGQTNVHDGFSVGMSRDDAIEAPVTKTVKDGVTYYVDSNDAWFFDNLDLDVGYDAAKDEPTYTFIPQDGQSDAVSGASKA
ncbi:HesB/YadR/YfhF family protein [Lacticaseibacillus sp. GG6-2]